MAEQLVSRASVEMGLVARAASPAGDTAANFLADICQHPADDTPRLIFADWLDDHGDEARAEFIRLQCEIAAHPEVEHCGDLTASWCPICGDCCCRDRSQSLADDDCPLHSPRSRHANWEDWHGRERELFEPGRDASWFANLKDVFPDGYILGLEPVDESCRPFRSSHAHCLVCRGFVSHVTLTALAFCGGPCGRCAGYSRKGHVLSSSNAYEARWLLCPDCHGTGETGALAAALFRSAPIEAVTLADREPGASALPSGLWYWEEEGFGQMGQCPYVVPAMLFDLLPGGVRDGRRTTAVPSRQRFYRSRELAQAALAAAALTWGRRQGWPCPTCQGKGEGTFPVEPAPGSAGLWKMAWPIPCPRCHGTGHTVE